MTLTQPAVTKEKTQRVTLSLSQLEVGPIWLLYSPLHLPERALLWRSRRCSAAVAAHATHAAPDPDPALARHVSSSLVLSVFPMPASLSPYDASELGFRFLGVGFQCSPDLEEEGVGASEDRRRWWCGRRRWRCRTGGVGRRLSMWPAVGAQWPSGLGRARAVGRWTARWGLRWSCTQLQLDDWMCYGFEIWDRGLGFENLLAGWQMQR
jgi:hypothetical protein